MNKLTEMGRQAQDASRILANLNSNQKNAALQVIAAEIESQSKIILAENAADIEAGRQKGHSEALLDRLLLTESRVAALAN